LETIAQGNSELTMVISFIKSNPAGQSYLDFLNDNRGKQVLDIDPKFLQFLPPSRTGLISEVEYRQVKLQRN
jgi:hypothetical protein